MRVTYDEDRVLTFADLKEKKRWPYTNVHTARLVKAGKFPKPFKTTENGRNLWLESDIDAYLTERARSARNKD